MFALRANGCAPKPFRRRMGESSNKQIPPLRYGMTNLLGSRHAVGGLTFSVSATLRDENPEGLRMTSVA